MEECGEQETFAGQETWSPWGPSQPDAEPRRSVLPCGCPRSEETPRAGTPVFRRWVFAPAMPHANALCSCTRCPPRRLAPTQRDANTRFSWENGLKSRPGRGHMLLLPCRGLGVQRVRVAAGSHPPGSCGLVPALSPSLPAPWGFLSPGVRGQCGVPPPGRTGARGRLTPHPVQTPPFTPPSPTPLICCGRGQ